ncbi:MAG TPA: hypothetical protein VFZ59_01820 [Verrucomicrobiae bacterium]|nr:hypothetical protein [Verrucomicrobiae bacterium]
MTQLFEQIYSKDERHLAAVRDESRDVVVLSTGFDPACKVALHPPRDLCLTRASEKLANECTRVLRTGGWLFIYGLPEELPFWALRFSECSSRGNEAHSEKLDGSQSLLTPAAAEPGEVTWGMVFRYWIALELDDAPVGKTLKPAHHGLLMFQKVSADKKAASLRQLNIDAARLPHAHCAACGNTLKDWGARNTS